jgi:hypothetical protein
MPLHLKAYSEAFDASGQLDDYSADVLLVAEVLPLNYTRMILVQFTICFTYSQHAPPSESLFGGV